MSYRWIDVWPKTEITFFIHLCKLNGISNQLPTFVTQNWSMDSFFSLENWFSLRQKWFGHSERCHAWKSQIGKLNEHHIYIFIMQIIYNLWERQKSVLEYDKNEGKIHWFTRLVASWRTKSFVRIFASLLLLCCVARWPTFQVYNYYCTDFCKLNFFLQEKNMQMKILCWNKCTMQAKLFSKFGWFCLL